MDKHICGNWATLLLPLNEDESINLNLLEEEIDYYISCRVDGIYSNGTAGEFFTLSREEFLVTSELLAKKCSQAGIPFQIGASRQSYQEMAERVELASQFSPLAIQVILPDWFPLTNEEIIEFFKGLAACSKGIPFVLYNPPHAKRVLTYQDYHQLLPHITGLAGIKVCDGDDVWYDNMKEVLETTSVFVPGHHIVTGISKGASGAYSNVACLCPGKAQRLFEMTGENQSRALELEHEIQAYMEEYMVPLIRDQQYANFAIDKFMAAMGGYTSITPRVRFPYRGVPEDYLEYCREGLKTAAPFFVEQELPNSI